MERTKIIPGLAQQQRIHIEPRTRVEHPSVRYLEEAGWVKKGLRYQGKYRTSRGTYWGEAEHRQGKINYFIFDPPVETLNGRHGLCFTHIGNNWWWIHFSKESQHPDDSIIAIERILEGNFNGRL